MTDNTTPQRSTSLGERVEAWFKQFATYKKAEQVTFLEQEAQDIIQAQQDLMREVLGIIKSCNRGTYRGFPVFNELDVLLVVDIHELLTHALANPTKKEG